MGRRYAPIKSKKRSEAVKKYWSNPEARQRASIAAINAWKRPEARKKQVESKKKVWKRPGFKEKRVRDMRLNWSKKHELALKNELQAKGWMVLDAGWPDFAAVKGSKIRFIEAKAPQSPFLSLNQKNMHVIFNRIGYPVEVIIKEAKK